MSKDLFSDISDLTQDPNNTRIHDKRNLDVIEMSIEEVGCARSIVIDEKGTVLAGNGTKEVAEKLGKKIKIVDGDRDTLIVVRRNDLSETEKTRLGLFDNRGTDLSKNNKAAIQRIATKSPSQRILKGIFNEREEKQLLSAHALAQPLAPGGAVDDDPELSAAPIVLGSSTTRPITLFFNTENNGAFVKKARRLGVLFNLTNLTDIIDFVVDKAHNEWMEEKAAANAGTSTN